MTKEGFIGHFVLDSTIRNSPSFQFGVKHKNLPNTSQLTPGPAAYYLDSKILKTGRESRNGPLILSRKIHRPRGSNSPGPADYQLGSRHDVLSQHLSPPSFSIPKASVVALRKTATPAPNAYDADPMLGRAVRSTKRSSPGFSIRSRSSIGRERTAMVPGPGSYLLPSTNNYMRRSACFSIAGRNFLPSDKTTKPGPAAHSIGQVGRDESIQMHP